MLYCIRDRIRQTLGSEMTTLWWGPAGRHIPQNFLPKPASANSTACCAREKLKASQELWEIFHIFCCQHLEKIRCISAVFGPERKDLIIWIRMVTFIFCKHSLTWEHSPLLQQQIWTAADKLTNSPQTKFLAESYNCKRVLTAQLQVRALILLNSQIFLHINWAMPHLADSIEHMTQHL